MLLLEPRGKVMLRLSGPFQADREDCAGLAGFCGVMTLGFRGWVGYPTIERYLL